MELRGWEFVKEPEGEIVMAGDFKQGAVPVLLRLKRKDIGEPSAFTPESDDSAAQRSFTWCGKHHVHLQYLSFLI